MFMQFSPVLRNGLLVAAFCLSAHGQAPEIKGLPPRNSATDYQAQGKAGNITIAAELAGHGVPTPQATFNTEDYIVVEMGIFGGPDAHATLSSEDFSVRINGKKQPVPSQPFALMLKTLKDPEWIPPDTGDGGGGKKSKGGLTGGGDSGGGGNDPPPLPPKMPPELRRAMEQKVQKAVLPEGDRALPVAGLLFFPYRGKTESIRSLELVYSGSAGKATLSLNP